MSFHQEFEFIAGEHLAQACAARQSGERGFACVHRGSGFLFALLFCAARSVGLATKNGDYIGNDFCAPLKRPACGLILAIDGVWVKNVAN
ncbi:hypothetical protein PPMP20_28285 [Paraburkholderia phymatum]|uniref:hypothetical protein n=1 Tax=Paraburkholderia phymatum TaxID=148447 RepID=UPI0002E10DAD|nr:hypothetical protein [Paraburkholderia phymatum]